MIDYSKEIIFNEWGFMFFQATSTDKNEEYPYAILYKHILMQTQYAIVVAKFKSKKAMLKEWNKLVKHLKPVYVFGGGKP